MSVGLRTPAYGRTAFGTFTVPAQLSIGSGSSSRLNGSPATSPPGSRHRSASLRSATTHLPRAGGVRLGSGSGRHGLGEVARGRGLNLAGQRPITAARERATRADSASMVTTNSTGAATHPWTSGPGGFMISSVRRVARSPRKGLRHTATTGPGVVGGGARRDGRIPRLPPPWLPPPGGPRIGRGTPGSGRGACSRRLSRRRGSCPVVTRGEPAAREPGTKLVRNDRAASHLPQRNGRARHVASTRPQRAATNADPSDHPSGPRHERLTQPHLTPPSSPSSP